MKEERARHILQALVQGVDPFTGEELPAGTILQQADVLRALLAGLLALEQTAARQQRRAQLPDNVGRPWTDDEEQTLIAAFKANDPVPDIAARHRRTVRAIEARLERLGLITPEQRSTNNSFVKKPFDPMSDTVHESQSENGLWETVASGERWTDALFTGGASGAQPP